MQRGEQFFQPGFLLRCTGVGGLSFGVQSAFVAYSDAAAVVPSGMRSYLQQLPVTGYFPVSTDVEVITHASESPLPVVAQHLFRRIFLVTGVEEQ